MGKSYRINLPRTSSHKPFWLATMVFVFTLCVFGIAGSASALTYTDLIWNAAVANNVNPYFLASRIRQEVCVGTGKSNSVTGTVAGYTGIYNFYNIGATSSDSPVASALDWAKNGTTYGRPWTDPQKSISGGANFLAQSYISVGQDSKYLQKFNVAPSNASALYTHQYMTNLAAPLSESSTTYDAYNNIGALSLGMVFYIPVYNSMPTLAGTPYTVTTATLNIRNTASTSGTIITTLTRGANVQVVSGGWNYTTSGGYTWAKITLSNGITGYAAQGDSSGAYLSAISGGSGTISGFPDSYQPYLSALKAKYTNWSFIPLNTGLDWNTAVSNELGSKSAVPTSTSPMAVQPAVSVESGWYQASQAAVAYYMDPRNALSSTGIFEFELLSFNSALHTQAGVQALLTGTFMAGTSPVTYVDTNGVTQTLGVVAPAVPASAPTNVKTSVTSMTLGNSITVSWTKVTGATKYRLRMYRLNSAGVWTNITLGSDPYAYTDYGNVSSLTRSDFVSVGSYKAYIFAGNASGWHTPGTYSNVFTIKAPAK